MHTSGHSFSTDSAPGQIPALVLMDLLKHLLNMYRALDSTTVLATWIVASAKPDLSPDEFPASPLGSENMLTSYA